MQWFYAVGQEQRGPVSEEEFGQRVADGTISEGTLVWNADMADWSPYGTVAQAVSPVSAVQPAGHGVADTNTLYCSQCNRPYRSDELVSYHGKHVCARCKKHFFQRVQEGASPLYSGNTPNGDLTAAARAHLAGYWGLAIGVTIVYNVINMAASSIPFIGSLAPLIIAGPFALGLATFFLGLVREQEVQFSMLFDGFQNFGTALLAYVLMTIFILLWMLLLIIPGIIAAYAYSQTFFIGFIWLMPYMSASFAEFYEDLTAEAQV